MDVKGKYGLLPSSLKGCLQLICRVLVGFGIFSAFLHWSWLCSHLPFNKSIGFGDIVSKISFVGGHFNFNNINWEEGQDQFREYMRRTKDMYPSQSFETRARIYSSINSTMTQEMPRQPSTIIVLTPPDLEVNLNSSSQSVSNFARCWIREIGINVHYAFQNITGVKYTENIYEIGPESFDNFEMITDIYDDITRYLNNGKVVIVNNVQAINTVDHLMVFYAFCDNTDAPDKRATFVFILPVPETIFKKYEWKDQYADEISQEVLQLSWTSLSLDSRPSLIGRVSENVVMLKPGDKCVQ